MKCFRLPAFGLVAAWIFACQLFATFVTIRRKYHEALITNIRTLCICNAFRRQCTRTVVNQPIHQ